MGPLPRPRPGTPFRALDLERVKTLMRTPVLVDLRNIYKPADVRALGFR